MTNADLIRNMTDEELNQFLWWHKLNFTARFMEHGGQGAMDAEQQLAWLKSDDPWDNTEFQMHRDVDCSWR